MDIIALIVQIVLAILYGVGLWIAYSVAQRQSKNDFFAEYTRRYENIILAMPEDVFEGTAKVDGTTLKYMQLYFDLCSEEYHLHKKGLIPDDVWDNWKEGMEITTHVELYKESWHRIKDNYNEAFCHFMEKEVLKLGNGK